MLEQFEVDRWFESFLKHLRKGELSGEVIEALSDCGNELLVNSITARHLRRWGRAKQGRLFWARCEWAKVDVSFGRAEEKFDNWEKAWGMKQTGDQGIIESKVCYSHLASDWRVQLDDLTRQLEDRRRRWNPPTLAALVWFLAHDGEQPAGLLGAMQREHFVARRQPEFTKIGSADLTKVWPMNAGASKDASLFLGLFSLPD